MAAGSAAGDAMRQFGPVTYPRRMIRDRRRRLAVVAAGTVLLGGCGQGGPVDYVTPVDGVATTYAVTVDEVTDPAPPPENYLTQPPEDSRLVGVEVTVTATPQAQSAVALASTCFTGHDSAGAEAQRLDGFTSQGEQQLNGMLTQDSSLSGQILFRVPDGETLSTLSARCDATGSDETVIELTTE